PLFHSIRFHISSSRKNSILPKEECLADFMMRDRADVGQIIIRDLFSGTSFMLFRGVFSLRRQTWTYDISKSQMSPGGVSILAWPIRVVVDSPSLQDLR